MKFEWEATDIKPGRRVWSENGSEQYIIGYDPANTGVSNLHLVSLADGMLARHGHTHGEMAKHLNECHMTPDQI
jgi:hypothetical protein